MCYTSNNKEKLNFPKIFFDNDTKKKNKELIKDIEDNKLRSLEGIREEILNTDMKLKPIEDEYKFNTFTNSIKNSFMSKMYSWNILNIILRILILLVICFNFNGIYKKCRIFSSGILPNDFESPIISILPEEIDKVRLDYEYN